MKKTRFSKWKKMAIGLLVGLVLLMITSVTILKFKTHQPSLAAREALEAKSVAETSAWIKFAAEGKAKNLSVIFYQGALVPAEAYSLWASQVAEAGYDVYLLKSPAALAITQLNLADKVLATEPIQAFVLGGHSLGGVVASRFAKSQSDNPNLRGVFFLGSYSDEKGSLVETDFLVLSLTGDFDEVLNKESYVASKKYLPADTEYEVLKGGNHAGFGSYGEQKGDGQGTLTNQEQQAAVADSLIKWLKELSR